MNNCKAEFRIRDDIRFWTILILCVQIFFALCILTSQKSLREKLCQTEIISAS